MGMRSHISRRGRFPSPTRPVFSQLCRGEILYVYGEIDAILGDVHVVALRSGSFPLSSGFGPLLRLIFSQLSPVGFGSLVLTVLSLRAVHVCCLSSLFFGDFFRSLFLSVSYFYG